MREHERWLRIVEDDLRSARGLLDLEIFSTAIYHCQQAAEKALKAYLVFKRCKVKRVHDLVMLVELCCGFNVDFQILYKDAGFLNPFSTKFRYPSEFDIPDYDDAQDAVKRTERIVNFVLKKLVESEAGCQQKIF